MFKYCYNQVNLVASGKARVFLEGGGALGRRWVFRFSTDEGVTPRRLTGFLGKWRELALVKIEKINCLPGYALRLCRSCRSEKEEPIMLRKLPLHVLMVIVCVSSLVAAAVGAPMTYNESPMLSERVASGELPPVDERLPINPVVIEPVDEIGTYGGQLALTGVDITGIGSTYWYYIEALTRLDRDGVTIVPNIAESVTPNEEGTVWTIALREGMRWSDGMPFTTEDVLFWYEDILLNEDLTPVFPTRWISGGEKMDLEVLDDYTFQVSFAEPYGTFMMRITRFHWDEFFRPKHWLKDYHIAYTPLEELQPMVEEAGFESWYQLFNQKWNTRNEVPHTEGPPTLRAYIIEEVPADNITIKSRNPYYWRVDTAGNQLPYIDRVRVDLVSDPESVTMKILAGEVDFMGFDTQVVNLPLYRANEDRGGFEALLYTNMFGSEIVFLPNNTHEDPAYRELINDARFRQALSLAMNRPEINEVVMFGLGEPTAATVVPWSRYFKPEYRTAYAEYDPDEANRLLDSMGLTERDSDGFRIGPDGKKVHIILEFPLGEGARVPITELVREHWQAVGIDVTLQIIDGSLWWSRMESNSQHMSLWHMDRSTDILFTLEPIWFIPVQTWHGWGIAWTQWYLSGGTTGEEPPDEIKELYAAFERMNSTVDEDERLRLGHEILQSQAENVWTIGTVGSLPHVVIVSNRLANIVPEEEGQWGYDGYFATLMDSVQWYLKD